MQQGRFTPVIITGAKRAGTTLLQCLFDSVPGVFNFLEEAYFFEYIYDLGRENVRPFINLQMTADIDDLFEATKNRSLFHIFEHGYRPAEGCANTQYIDFKHDVIRLKRYLKEYRKEVNPSIASIWKWWALAFMNSMGCDTSAVKTVVMKSPDYGKSAISALKYFTDPKILVLVRNPIYSIDSLKKSRIVRKNKELHMFELLNVIKDYKFLLDTVLSLERSGRGNGVMTIRYEDLVLKPEKTMRDVAQFIGIAFNKSLLNPTFMGDKWQGESSFRTFDSIAAESTRRKIATLSDWEIKIIQSELRDFLARFRY